MQRATQQKAAIARVLREAGRPLCVAELLEGARQFVPSLSIATIYRNINAMQATGQVAAVELPGDTARYELSSSAAHDHFKCSMCRRVYNVPRLSGPISSLAPAGFRVTAHSLTLYGTCPSCVS